MSDQDVIAIDLGGTKIEIALVSPEAKIRDSKRLYVGAFKDAQDIISAMIDVIKDFATQSDRKIKACGVAVAGQVDITSKEIICAPNLGWRSLPLAKLIENPTGLKVILINDVRAALLGELHYGAAKGASDSVCIFVGTGIGGGIISCGNILVGSNNAAGEIGHMVVDVNGPQCSCGNRGCLEAIASGWAIAKAVKKQVQQNSKYAKAVIDEANGEEISALHVSRCASRGDAFASEIMNTAFGALAAGAISIANIFNPERIIFGGGVFHGQSEWPGKIAEEIQKRALKAVSQKISVLPATLGCYSGVIGASIIARVASSE